MNRRGFFRTLATVAAAASLSPTVFIPKFEPVRWKRMPPIIYQRNPEWVTAEYEVFYIDQPPIFDPEILFGNWTLTRTPGCFPVRIGRDPELGTLKIIPPFISA